ncbi:annexin B9 isoform X2 [Leptinotarsa decemlineata]|uniref:annexin B9 isoform X2 n=1 Tax=Leptinotarsa decemlineata TaxID=7539 RepID=UPI003D309F50
MAPTVLPYQNFKDEEDAQLLKDAMDGLGTNEEAIIQILSKRTNEQRRMIANTYKTMFGEDLIDDLKSELGGHFEDVIMALLEEPVEYQVKELRNAISGMGTDDCTIVEILSVHNNEEVLQIANRYQEKYESSLEEDIKSDESGTLERLLVSLSTGNRDESYAVDKNAAIIDAQALYDAGEGTLGTEESVFNAILCTRSRVQAKLIFEQYEAITGHSIEEAIDNEFSGTTKDAILGLVSCLKDRTTYLATRLHDAMSGLGTTDKTLIRIIVSRSEIDLEEIKNAYEAKYETNLAERISNDTSGDYSKILLAIVN